MNIIGDKDSIKRAVRTLNAVTDGQMVIYDYENRIKAEELMGIKINRINSLGEMSADKPLLVLISDPQLRQQCIEQLSDATIAPAIVGKSTIVPSVIGDGTFISDHCRIAQSAKIGKYCMVGYNTVIGKNCTIEDYVTIGDDCKIGDGVVIKKGATIGSKSVITNKTEIGAWSQVLTSTYISKNVDARTMVQGLHGHL